MTEEDWPRAGSRVEVHLAAVEEALLAVVDDVRPPEQLHLREPVTQQGGAGPETPCGTPLQLCWSTGTGYHVMDVLLTDLPERRARLWRLEPAGPVQVLQRRAFIRVPDMLPIEIRFGEQMWRGSVCDISEGGARCVLPGDVDLEPGDHVQVDAEIEGMHITVAAAVVGVESTTGSRTTARLQFAELQREGDVIRRRVLDVQRRARALERM